MLTKTVLGLVLLLLSPAYATITSLAYYRSALCDLQHPMFFLDRYTPTKSLLDDKTCHQAPAKTMAMKMFNEIDPRCVVLAYADYSCSELVGAVPASGKCLAAAKARIGSWKAFCNTTTSATSDEKPEISYVPSELKRRSIARLPRIHQQVRNVNTTTTVTIPCTTATATAMSQDNRTVVASSVAHQISSGISASDAIATTTAATFPSAGAQLSSVISSGSALDGNLTSYVTFTGTVTAMSTSASNAMKTIQSTPLATVAYSGTSGRNGTATLHMSSAESAQMAVGDRALFTVVAGMVAILFGAIVL